MFGDRDNRILVGSVNCLDRRTVPDDVAAGHVAGADWSCCRAILGRRHRHDRAWTIWSGVLGLLLGVLSAMGKRSPFWVLRQVADGYVWIMRGTPLLMQILFFYLAMPAMLPDLKISEFWTAVVALSLNVGAYNAEVIRAGINAVPAGQVEAARSLGLSKAYTFWDVVLPQAVRRGAAAAGQQPDCLA